MSIVETMRGIAQRELYKLHLPTLGVVTSIFPHSAAGDKDNYECNVRLKNADVELRKVPIATQCIGLAGIPRVGDLVMVLFIDGDVNAPIVVGRLYNDEDRPPLNNAEEIIYVPPYNADPKVRRIYLEFPQGMIFKITDDEVDIKAGDTKVIVLRNGDVVIESKANVNVTADGDATLKSKGNMTITGSSIKIESDNDLNLKSGTDMKMNSGASAEIKSSAGMNVEATAQMKIKGAQVNIN
jgi:phage baseplate assembly protein gpV